MKPSDDKIPEELRNRILEQMPWLNNPIKTIPIVDPADIRPCGNSLKILKHNPVNQERCAYSIAKPRGVQPRSRYCECRLSAGNVGIGEHGYRIELSRNPGWKTHRCRV
jgi:hypothetical protein